MARNSFSTGDRKPHAADLYVGRRIRMRRAVIGMSQEKLAEAVGLTFQQIQKYERGQSRVSAGRLYQFALILGTDIPYFYDGFRETKETRSGSRKSSHPAPGFSDNHQEPLVTEEQLYSRETIELLRDIFSIKEDRRRKDIIRLCRSLIANMTN